MNIGIDSVVVQDHRLLASEIGGETVILDTDSGQYLSLNESATTIWEHAVVPVSVRDILELVMATYDVQRAQAEADVFATLKTMLDKGLIHVQQQGPLVGTSGAGPGSPG